MINRPAGDITPISRSSPEAAPISGGSAETSPISRPQQSHALIFIILLATILRFAGIYSTGLTCDEAMNIDTHEFSQIMEFWFEHDHPPLYHLLIALLHPVFGYNFIPYRFISLVFGLLAILGTWYLAGILCPQNTKIQQLAPLFMAIMPGAINFSRRAVSYSFDQALVVWSLYFLAYYGFSASSRKRPTGHLYAGTVLGALAGWSHYMAILPPLGAGLWLFINCKKDAPLKRAAVIAVLLILPLVIVLLRNPLGTAILFGGEQAEIRREQSGEFSKPPLDFAKGSPMWRASKIPGALLFYPAHHKLWSFWISPVVVATCGLLAVILGLVLMPRDKRGFISCTLLTSLSGFGFLAIMAAFRLGVNASEHYHVFTILPLLAITVSCAARHVLPKKMSVFVLLFIFAGYSTALLDHPRFRNMDARDIGQILDKYSEDADATVVIWPDYETTGHDSWKYFSMQGVRSPEPVYRVSTKTDMSELLEKLGKHRRIWGIVPASTEYLTADFITKLPESQQGLPVARAMVRAIEAFDKINDTMLTLHTDEEFERQFGIALRFTLYLWKNPSYNTSEIGKSEDRISEDISWHRPVPEPFIPAVTDGFIHHLTDYLMILYCIMLCFNICIVMFYRSSSGVSGASVLKTGRIE